MTVLAASRSWESERGSSHGMAKLRRSARILNQSDSGPVLTQPWCKKRENPKARCFRQLVQKQIFVWIRRKYQDFKNCLISRLVTLSESGFRNVIVKCTLVGEFSGAFGISSFYGKPTLNLLKLTNLRKEISSNCWGKSIKLKLKFFFDMELFLLL